MRKGVITVIQKEGEYPHAAPNLTIRPERDLRVRAVVLSDCSENGFSSIDFILKALETEDEPYRLTLVQNPLINYDAAMKRYQEMKVRRAEFLEKNGSGQEPPDCSWQEIEGIWLVAHWYQVDEYADRMIVGMSVAAWLGFKRSNTVIDV